MVPGLWPGSLFPLSMGMMMLKAYVRHPGRARYWLRRRDTPATVAKLTAGFSDVGAFIGRRRKVQSANDEKFVVVLPLTT